MQDEAPYIKQLRNIRQDELQEIITDDKDIFEQASEFLKKHQPGDLDKLRLYEDKLLPLHKLYGIESQLTNALKERGAKSVRACATHGVLSGPAIQRIKDSVLEELVLLDTIPVSDEKKEEFADKASRIIDKALKRLERAIDEEEYIPVNQLTTAIGTLYDKRALARGESTENTKITFDLPPEVSDYAE